VIAATIANLRDAFEQLYLPIKLRSRAANTKRLYRFSLDRFDEYLGRRARIGDLDEVVVCSFLAWRRSTGVAASTVERDRYNLLAVWRFLNRRRMVDTWPEIEPEVIPERVALAWTEADVHRLLDACRLAEGSISRCPASVWWQCLHLIAWDTGERIAAIVGLKWPDVDLDQAVAVCRAETRKGGRLDRCYPLAAETVAALRLIPRESPSVLTWPYSKTYLWNRYDKLLERAGLPHGRESKFHRLRRSVASHYAAAGHNATELLGHSSAKVTKRYLDPRIVTPPSPVGKIFRP
jgi:integrase